MSLGEKQCYFMYWADCCVDNSYSKPEAAESSVHYSETLR